MRCKFLRRFRKLHLEQSWSFAKTKLHFSHHIHISVLYKENYLCYKLGLCLHWYCYCSSTRFLPYRNLLAVTDHNNVAVVPASTIQCILLSYSALALPLWHQAFIHNGCGYHTKRKIERTRCKSKATKRIHGWCNMWTFKNFRGSMP
jgi:hypothetical protein